MCVGCMQAVAVRQLLAHRLCSRSSGAAKTEWYDIVEGTHPLWEVQFCAALCTLCCAVLCLPCAAGHTLPALHRLNRLDAASPLAMHTCHA
jgi:hypothetical protein